MAHRVFLLSPARLDGKRAGYLFSDAAKFDLALRLRSADGVELGELFRFLSGLYFRGKLAYSAAFAQPSNEHAASLVITTNRGLLPPSTRVTLAELKEMAAVPIDLDEPRYRTPLERDLRILCHSLGEQGHVVLLGSIATAKYVDILADCLGPRLRFPTDFIGRGDMSRGALMLRRAASGIELDYAPVHAEMTRTGKRAPRVGSA